MMSDMIWVSIGHNISRKSQKIWLVAFFCRIPEVSARKLLAKNEHLMGMLTDAAQHCHEQSILARAVLLDSRTLLRHACVFPVSLTLCCPWIFLITTNCPLIREMSSSTYVPEFEQDVILAIALYFLHHLIPQTWYALYSLWDRQPSTMEKSLATPQVTTVWSRAGCHPMSATTSYKPLWMQWATCRIWKDPYVLNGWSEGSEGYWLMHSCHTCNRKKSKELRYGEFVL